jgi:MFS family permease
MNDSPERAEEQYPSASYAWYVVGVLTLVYVFSFIDRQILNLLVRPIRRDLGISDTEMSLLMGFSFAVFYTFFGIPLGRLADTRSRRTIIAVGFAFWSLFTAGCGLAKNFGQMLLMRMGVGVGEAALSPAAYSMITDCFPPRRRATALSVYSMGIYIGSGIAFIIGGLVSKFATQQELWQLPVIGATRPWQVVFFIVGLPGVLLALLMFTLREPARRGAKMNTAGQTTAPQIPLGEVLAYIRENWRTFLCHNMGFALLSISGYGSSAWVTTMFVRKYGWTEADDVKRPTGGGLFNSGGVFHQHAFRRSACRHSTNDAQRHARTSLGKLSFRQQSHRSRHRADSGGADDRLCFPRRSNGQLFAADREHRRASGGSAAAVGGAEAFSPQPGSFARMECDACLKLRSRVISFFGAHDDPLGARFAACLRQHAHRDFAPFAIGVGIRRHIAETVLLPQFERD